MESRNHSGGDDDWSVLVSAVMALCSLGIRSITTGWVASTGVPVPSRGSETIQQTRFLQLWEIFADSEVNVRNFGNIWKPGSSCLRHRLAAKVLGRHLRLTFPHLFNRPAKNKNGVNRRDLYPFFFLKMFLFHTSLLSKYHNHRGDHWVNSHTRQRILIKRPRWQVIWVRTKLEAEAGISGAKS